MKTTHNTKWKLSKYLLTSSFVLFSCTSLSQGQKQIDNTIRGTVESINKNDYIAVVNKIGVEHLIRDTFGIKMEVLKTYYILTKYFNNQIDQLKWETDGQPDNLGRVKYSMQLFNGFDSTTGYKDFKLNLYFGPPEIIPYDKLSNFEIDVEMDVSYRRFLREKGRLLNIVEIVNRLTNESEK